MGGCLFDDTLADLEIRPTAGRTRVTFFVGPRFSSLKVYELPESRQLVFDFLGDSSTATLDPTPTLRATPRTRSRTSRGAATSRISRRPP